MSRIQRKISELLKLRLVIFQRSKRKYTRQIFEIIKQSREAERDLTIDEGLEILAALRKRNAEQERQIKEFEQIKARNQERKLVQRKRFLAVATVLLILLPFSWLIFKKPSESKEFVEKTIPDESSVGSPSPKRKVIPILPLEPQKGAVGLALMEVKQGSDQNFEEKVVNYESRDLLMKDVRILEREDYLSVWNRDKDTLFFRMTDAKRNKVYEEKFTYLHSVSIDKRKFRPQDGYFYYVYAPKYKLILQGKL